jgi:hypothetical protein
MTGRQCAKLIAFADEECIGRDHERIGPQLGQGFEYRSEVVLGASLHDMELQAESAGSRLHLSRHGLCDKRARRVDEERDGARGGNQLVQ